MAKFGIPCIDEYGAPTGYILGCRTPQGVKPKYTLCGWEALWEVSSIWNYTWPEPIEVVHKKWYANCPDHGDIRYTGDVTPSNYYVGFPADTEIANPTPEQKIDWSWQDFFEYQDLAQRTRRITVGHYRGLLKFSRESDGLHLRIDHRIDGVPHRNYNPSGTTNEQVHDPPCCTGGYHFENISNSEQFFYRNPDWVVGNPVSQQSVGVGSISYQMIIKNYTLSDNALAFLTAPELLGVINSGNYTIEATIRQEAPTIFWAGRSAGTNWRDRTQVYNWEFDHSEFLFTATGGITWNVAKDHLIGSKGFGGVVCGIDYDAQDNTSEIYGNIVTFTAAEPIVVWP